MKEIKPDCFLGDEFSDLLPKKWYNPIYECNIKHRHFRYSIWSVVPDSIFFNFTDREKALTLIDEISANRLKSIGFLKWNDSQLLEYLTKRVIDRAK